MTRVSREQNSINNDAFIWFYVKWKATLFQTYAKYRPPAHQQDSCKQLKIGVRWTPLLASFKQHLINIWQTLFERVINHITIFALVTPAEVS